MKVDILVFIFILFFLFCIYGWVLNIYKLVQLDFNPPYKAEVIRIIGVPIDVVGVVVGYFNFDEER